jgi:uncharacterized protein
MITKSQFKPAYGLSNPHIQTLLPTLLLSKTKVSFIQQTFELNDGDFLDLAWTEKPNNNKPIIIVFHGLEGSIYSPYAKSIMPVIKQQGWIGLLMHFRGSSGRPNRLPRSYHSGETEDAKALINCLKEKHPLTPLAAIGFSLGGNMLLKLQGELGESSPLKAAISVCAPLVLASCAIRLDTGFSRIYQHHLIKEMKKNLSIKAREFNYENIINSSLDKIDQLKTFWEFDDLITAPLHGFKNVDDYYSQSSSRQYLKKIMKPTLIIQALDDPFMGIDVIPDEAELSEYTQLELSQSGGHIGFISGHLFKPVFWLEERISEYLLEKF